MAAQVPKAVPSEDREANPLRRRKQLVGPKPGPTPEAPHTFTQQQTLHLPLFKAAEEALRGEAKVSLAMPSEHLHNLTRSSHKPSG